MTGLARLYAVPNLGPDREDPREGFAPAHDKMRA